MCKGARKSTHAQDFIGKRLAKWRNYHVAKQIVPPFLDIACGDNLLAHGRGNEGIGIDIIDHGSADLIVSDFADLPFESESYMTITIVASLNYFDDPISVMTECKRLLKPDGRLIVTMLAPAVGLLWHLFREPWAKHSGMSSEQIATIAHSSGLQLIRKFRFMFWMNSLYVLKKINGLN